ncbi:yeeP protein, partial [Escherichia coli 0.1288]
FPTMPPVP